MHMIFGDMELRLLNDGMFKLDGGAVFGLVPKPLWEKTTPADEANRVPMRCGVLLVRHRSANMLIDAGWGTKLPPKLQSIYGIEGCYLVGALAEAGLAPEDIDIVIFTHLHVDHAGGATYLDDSGNPVPTFGRAEHVVQTAEWGAALNPNELTRGSYQPDDLLPLEAAGLVRLVDGDCDLIDGVKLVRTGGHTQGHQMVLLESDGRTAAFLGDLIPTTKHLKLSYTSGYDLYPMDLVPAKKALIESAVAQEWLLIFQHDPDVEMGTLGREGELVLRGGRPTD